MFYVADLRRQGLVVYSLTDQVPDSLDGRLMESILDWKNAKFIEDLSRNVRRGQRYVVEVHHAAFRGKLPAGYKRSAPVAIGKRRDGSPHTITRLEPDDLTAPLVALAFRMRASGATCREIHNATHLYKWVSEYSDLLHNPLYIGQLKTATGIVAGFCPPLIDEDTWQQVQQVNLERRLRMNYNQPRSLRSRFWLTGLIYCRRCTERMFGYTTKTQRGQRQYDYYRCGNKLNSPRCPAALIPKAELEAIEARLPSWKSLSSAWKTSAPAARRISILI